MIPKQEPQDGKNYNNILSCLKTEDTTEETIERRNESPLEETTTKEPNVSHIAATALSTHKDPNELNESPSLRELQNNNGVKRISECRGPSTWYWIRMPSTSSNNRPGPRLEETDRKEQDVVRETKIVATKQEPLSAESEVIRSTEEESMTMITKKEQSNTNEAIVATCSSPEDHKEAAMSLLRDTLAPNLSITTKRGSSTWCWLPSNKKKRKTPTAAASTKPPKKIKSEPFDEAHFSYKPPQEVSLGWYWLKNPDGSFAMGSSKSRRKYASKRSKSSPENSSKSSRKLPENKEVEGAWHWLKNPDGSFAMGSGKARRKYARKRKKPPPVKSSKPFPKLQQKNLSWYWLKAPDGSFAIGSDKARGKHSYPPSILESDNDDSESDASFDFDEENDVETSRDKCNYIDQLWEKKFKLLEEYQKKHETTRVPKGSPLGTWVVKQRQAFHQNILSQYREQYLNSIGFDFDPKMTDWKKMYNKLLSYKKQHSGSTGVPFSKRYKKLAHWIHNQKIRYHKQTISQEKQDLLESIGIEWEISEVSQKEEQLYRKAWMKMYQRLVAYKQKNKTTCVPSSYEADPQLGTWVLMQRKYCRIAERVNLLNYIGFEWNPNQSDWLDMYRRLVAYKAEHNSTRVPYDFEADPKLAAWVSTQRQFCRQKNRVDLLNKIGFDWNPLQENWLDMYQQLVAYKAEHNTTRVPWRCEAYSKLYVWIVQQRESCRQKDRVDLLNKLGFDWDPRGIRSKSASR